MVSDRIVMLTFLKFNPMFFYSILVILGCRDDIPGSSVECSNVVSWQIPIARYPVMNPGIFWANNLIKNGMPCHQDGFSIKNFG